MRRFSPLNAIQRREALAAIAASAAGFSVTRAFGQTVTAGAPGANLPGVCVRTTRAAEGPFYFDEKLVRSDITEGRPGVPLKLQMHILDVRGCTPVAGAAVQIWHADADGLYSGYQHQFRGSASTVGQTFLRGTQVSDAKGLVTFETIYPGWYTGRTVHIHFKARSGSLEFTSQLYFDETITAQVYGQSPYAARGLPNMSNAQDGIFDAVTLLTLTPDGTGYVGTFNVAMNLS